MPEALTGFTVAVVGSGPSGLAAAQQLTRAGHQVTVFERDDAIGGLLRYGIPEFKMEKRHLDRRLAQMEAEGTRFVTGVPVESAAQLAGFSAVVLAGGARVARDLPVPGRDLAGIHQAMEFLPLANRHGAGSPISAAGKHVVIIGGGDTGADCLGTSHRQGAASVTQLEIMPRPPKARAEAQPWPTYPMIYRVSSAHEEGGDRVYAASTEEFVGDPDGAVRALRLTEVAFEGGRFAPVPGSRKEIPCDLALLAMGFTGAEQPGLLADLGVDLRRARQRGPRRLVPDVGARRVRGRRHGPRPVADRLGDRRGPQRRGLRRPVPPRSRPPLPPVGDPADGQAARLAGRRPPGRRQARAARPPGATGLGRGA